ncbi:olfactory receptor [Danaus plexippus plexippus]|uniref:Odorant receptor n=1 Tax=Danaus plexippus plexippus TaxID=278856 RepID=A0A212EGS3_DANPL|nr:olfactory receptor [Danaus plexippus plexippus]
MGSLLKWLFNPRTAYIKKSKASVKDIIDNLFQDSGVLLGKEQTTVPWKVKISIFCFLVCNLLQLIALILALGDLDELLACSGRLTFLTMSVPKLFSIFLSKKLWDSLITQTTLLENEVLNKRDLAYEYESEDEEDDYLTEHIDSYTKQFQGFAKILSSIYFYAANVYVLSPFIEYGYHVYKGNDRMYPHILPGWSPQDANVISYSVLIVAEVIAAEYCVKLHTVYDVTAVGLMIFIRGQFLLLHQFSEHIGGRGNDLSLSRRRDDRAHCRIKKCHYIHVSLLKSISDLDDLIRNVLGIYFCIAAMTLCSAAVQLLKWNSLDAMEIVSLLQFPIATLIQLYLFCLYGDGMFNEVVNSIKTITF